MAIVFEETLKKNIAKGVGGVYILFGNDGYLKKNYAERISKKTAEKDDVFNYSKFSGECLLQEVYDACMQLALMNDKKYVELVDFDFEKCSKAELTMLCELICSVPETTVFVMRFDTFSFDEKKSSKFKSLLSSCDEAGGLSVKLSHRSRAELAKMLQNGALKRGGKMDYSAANYLLETAGEDIELLQNELNKLIYFANGNLITKQTVDKVSVKSVEASVYSLSKYILATETEKALSCLNELLYMRIEPMIILYTVSGVFVDMYRVFSAKREGKDNSTVIKTFSYKNKAFLVENASRDLRRYDFKRLNLCLEALIDADRSLKSFGGNDRVILEQLILRLVYITAEGEKVD